MAKIVYQKKKFKQNSLWVIQQANRILNAYEAQGYDLTLRQLYYQFVSKDLIPNKATEYNKLGSIVNDARLAGLIDWDHITDRTRNVRRLSHWTGPHHVIESAANGYQKDLWAGQSHRCEVWIEKDALVGVIEGICNQWDVPFFSCRGYTSQSEMWGAAQRILPRLLEGTDVTVFHLGDHDPSGIDMTRDIHERLDLFLTHDMARAAVAQCIEKEGFDRADMKDVESAGHKRAKEIIESYGTLFVDRIGLNMDQVDQYNPPPNPAKVTDARFEGYQRIHGDESWELDALEPSVISNLIDDAIQDIVDQPLFDTQVEKMEAERAKLQEASSRWSEVQEFLDA